MLESKFLIKRCVPRHVAERDQPNGIEPAFASPGNRRFHQPPADSLPATGHQGVLIAEPAHSWAIMTWRTAV